MKAARLGNSLIGSSDSKLRRWRCLEGKPAASNRMAEFKLPRVQHVARKAPTASVKRIAQNRTTQML